MLDVLRSARTGFGFRAAWCVVAVAAAAAAQNDRPGADALRELGGGQRQDGVELERSKAKWPEYEREVDEAVARQDAALKKGGAESDDVVKHYENRAQVRAGALDYYLAGRILGNVGRIEEARARFETAIKLDPFLPWAYHGLATCHAKREKFDDAVVSYKRALELNPDFLRSMEPLAGCLVQVGRIAEAEELLRRIVDRNPQHAQALLTLAKLQLGRLRYGEAVATAKRMLTVAPNDPEGLRVLGYCLRKAEMWDEAIRHYQQMLQREPDDFGANKALGQIHLRRGENRLARERFEAGLKVRGDVASQEVEELRRLVDELKKRPDVEKRNPNQKTPQEWMEILLNSSEPERCEEAARVLLSAPLEQLDDAMYVDIQKTFLNALKLKHAPAVQTLVLRHLARRSIYEPADLINLAALFVDHKDPRVRGMAVWFLGETRAPAAVPVVMGVLNDADPYVFECVHDSLFKLTPAYVSPRLPETVDKDVIKRVGDEWRAWYAENRDRYRRFEPKTDK